MTGLRSLGAPVRFVGAHAAAVGLVVQHSLSCQQSCLCNAHCPHLHVARKLRRLPLASCAAQLSSKSVGACSRMCMVCSLGSSATCGMCFRPIASATSPFHMCLCSDLRPAKSASRHRVASAPRMMPHHSQSCHCLAAALSRGGPINPPLYHPLSGCEANASIMG